MAVKKILKLFQDYLRTIPLYVRFRWIQQIGFGSWWSLRKILRTPPIYTDPVLEQDNASCEVHILTWDRDWLMSLWTAKTFYHFSGVKWPLVWHIGGSLKERRIKTMQEHFPNSCFLLPEETQELVERKLKEQHLNKCLEARRKSVMMIKLIDCVLLSRAKNLLLVDSDILFFNRPREILDAALSDERNNLFNRDIKNSYSISPENVKARYGFELVEKLNAGLSLIRRDTIPLAMIEDLLSDPDILSSPLLTEQTLYALCASKNGVRFLPSTYVVSSEPGLHTANGEPIISKHYAAMPRLLFFQEGIQFLIKNCFLNTLYRVI